MNNKPKGFTLIEIIVVLIILGLLAAIAVPSYFDWIKKVSLAEETLTELRSLKDQALVCFQVHTPSECESIFALAYHQTNNFVYGLNATSSSDWSIVAWPKVGNQAGLSPMTDSIWLGQISGGNIFCYGNGASQGIC